MIRSTRLAAALLLMLVFPSHGQVQGPAGNYAITLATAGDLPSLAGPLTGPAGVYTTTTTAPTTVTTTIDANGNTVVTISWTGSPTPTPPPVPPPPTPPVQTGNLYILALFDKTVPASAAQASIQASPTVGPTLSTLTKSATTTWAVGDVSSPAFAGWVAAAKAAGIPALVVLSVDQANKGTKIEAIPLPTPESAVIAEIKKIRGLP